MERIIKFRAWDKLNNCMLNEDVARILMFSRNPVIIPCQNEKTKDGFMPYLRGPIDIFKSERFIPIEFTGLKDKNRKEIYEGDILGGIMLSGVVQWNSSLAKYTVQLTPEGWHDLSSLNNMKEIIGNIYENPELLKHE